MPESGERTCTLPKGFTDPDGKVYRKVTLRPARVRDEIRALEDFRVYLRPESLPHVLLARVITALGPLRQLEPGLLERLPPEDLTVLEMTYRDMNEYPPSGIPKAEGQKGVTP